MTMKSTRRATLLVMVGAFNFVTTPLAAARASARPPTRHQASPSAPAPDSADLRDRAEDAQARFERRHRRLLPYTLNSSGGECRERIGRLCIYHDGEDDWVPAADPLELVQARDRLLSELGEIGGRLPGDEWILGQRVRYLSEAGRRPEAADLTRDCAVADVGWCLALEGFVLHGMGRYEAALVVFREGLSSMDPEEASRWRDPRILLDGRGSDLLREAEREDRREVRSVVWTLADPLYLMPGNDRESEHYARWTYAKISDGAESVWGMRWGDDLEELTLRYGWERGWERHRPRVGTSSTSSSVVGHQLPGGKEFVPPGRVLDAPWRTEPGSWMPEEDEPRSAHVAAYAPDLLPLEAQVAVFHRGDSIVVTAATRIPTNLDEGRDVHARSRTRAPAAEPRGPIAWPQPALLDRPEQVGLFLLGRRGEFHETTAERREGALELTVPAGDYLVSVEAWSPREGAAGRRRHGISVDAVPDDLATLSDLILLDVADSLPQDLDSALDIMRPSTRLSANERIAVGWELFGLGWRPEDVEFELSFYREGEGFFGRIGRWLGLRDREEPLRIGWDESGPFEVGPWFRSVEVTLPGVDPGQYVFRLEVATRGRDPLVRSRVVEIRR